MVDAVKILGSLLASGALSKGSGNNVLGSVLGAALGGGGGRQGGGNPMMDVLGSLMGGGQQSRSGGGGLAGAVLGSLLKGGGGGAQTGGGGLGGMLGGLLGGGGQPQQAPMARGGAGGGMGDLLGSLLGGGQAQGGGGQGGLGALLGGAMAKYAQSQNPAAANAAAQFIPTGAEQRQAEEQATVIVRAMINAAKADGQVDQKELQQITGKMGQMGPDEINWLKSEISAPLDVNAMIKSVPRGMEQQIYAMSLMAIDLDTQQEAKYLHELAQGLGIPANVCNQLHEQLGAPKIFA
ncbi:MAG: DUF533 domain-containing protein [Thiotrichales bacterium]